jgi:hypothetical protein
LSLASALIGESSITAKQLESLISYARVVKGEMRLREAAAQRSGRPVTVGSYYRTVQQGRRRVRQSVVTLAIAIATGSVRVDDVVRLFDLVGKGSDQLSEEEVERFVAVFDALLDKIVM